MRNKSTAALLVSALMMFAAVSLAASAAELRQSEELTETLTRKTEAAESENRALQQIIANSDREEAIMSKAEENFGFSPPQMIIFIDKG